MDLIRDVLGEFVDEINLTDIIMGYKLDLEIVELAPIFSNLNYLIEHIDEIELEINITNNNKLEYIDKCGTDKKGNKLRVDKYTRELLELLDIQHWFIRNIQIKVNELNRAGYNGIDILHTNDEIVYSLYNMGITVDRIIKYDIQHKLEVVSYKNYELERLTNWLTSRRDYRNNRRTVSHCNNDYLKLINGEWV